MSNDNYYSKQSDINKSVGVSDIIGDNILISEQKSSVHEISDSPGEFTNW